MTRQDVKNIIIEKIVDLTETEEKIDENTLIIRELGLSSMEVMVLVSEMEDEFDCDLPMKKISKVKTIGDFTEVVIDILKG